MHSKLVWAFPVMLLMFVALGVVLLAGGSAVAGAAWIVGGVVAVGGMWWMRRTNLDRYRRAEQPAEREPATGPGPEPATGPGADGPGADGLRRIPPLRTAAGSVPAVATVRRRPGGGRVHGRGAL